MRTTATLIKLLFKTWIRSKVSLFFGLAFPIMLLLVFGTIFGGASPPNYRLYIRNLDVDSSGSPGVLSEAFIQALNNSVFEVVPLKPEDPTPRSTGFAAVRVLTIPKGFTSNLLNMTIANRVDITADTIRRMVEMAGAQIPEQARANITASMQAFTAFKQTIPAERKTLVLEGSPDDRVLQPIEGIINVIASKFELALLNASSAVEVKTTYSQVRQMRTVDYYLPGYTAAFIMTNGLIGVSSLVSDMKRSGVIKLLASTPVSKTSWIVSLVVVQTFAALLLTAVMLAVGWAVFRITALPDFFSLSVILLGTLAFTGFGVLIGGVLREAEAVTAVGNTLSFPMMFLSGAFWPMELMPPFLQEVAKFVPLYYFHVALRETLLVGSLATAILPTAVVAVMALLGISLAVLTTKWRDF
ncbi:MAG: ABC transporter permease [Candidatus Caldarchaeum sp.]|nr:ABC transporter permease [Candidatus Caldarchaeum sp.]MDW7977889.1 ABC transporter permease [Candidatus Caldarchaeum sp.]